MKRIIQISFFTISVFLLIGLTGFIVIQNRTNNIGEIEVNIYRNTESGFISKDEVFATIKSIDSSLHAGLNQNENVDSLNSTLNIKEIKTKKIEEILSNNPYIDKVDSYITVDGNILINIKEKEPVIRIFDKGKQGCYIDKNGNIFPLSRSYAPRVLITNGYIVDEISDFNSNITDSIYDGTVMREVFFLTQLINQNSLLKAQINQIYVNSKGEYDLIPEIGDHVVKFGNMDDATIKLRNLEAYYQKYLKASNWNSYSTINLTYKDQIVCTKK